MSIRKKKHRKTGRRVLPSWTGKKGNFGGTFGKIPPLWKVTGPELRERVKEEEKTRKTHHPG